MRSPRLILEGAVIVLLATTPALAKVSRISWRSVQGLFPGPKPEQWTLAPNDLAPWRSQTAGDRSFTGVGYGDERPWNFQGQAVKVVVVQMPLALGCRQGPIGLIVGVLDSQSKLIARSAELLSEGSNIADVNAREKIYRLDTAPYRISDSETALGLRIVHYNAGKHWCYADQVLHLFRVVGKDVVRILTTDAFYEQVDWVKPADGDADESEEDPECYFSYSEPFPPKGQAAVFRMLSGQTKGFYDIQRTQKGGPAVTYRWDGQRYLMDGKDPIDHHVREDWDWCSGPRYLKDNDLPPPAPSKIDPKSSSAPALNPSKH